jgi:2-polyprenyl-6-methoxyphenol hydroxylase-like FAD-dependent oxidoreductase
VAIVGGSLAGSAAATFFGRAGLKVALLERHADPKAYKRLCTTVIQAGAVPTIRRLGLDAPIEAAGGLRTGLALWTRWGWIRDTQGGERGYDIRREKLDPMIRELAASTSGVDYLPGRTVHGLVTEGGRVTGVGVERADGRSEEIRARLVVGADGRTSEVAKLGGVGARVVRNHNRAGYFAYFRNVELPHPGHFHTWMLEPDVAYAFPHDDGFTILAVMFPKDQAPAFKQDVQGNLLAKLHGVPHFPRFDPADQVSKVLGLIDYTNLWRHRPPPGLAFAGDAAVAADPLFGVGCGWALQEAEWLADATASAFGSDREIDKGVSRYCSTLRSKLSGHFFLISDYSTGRAFNPLEKLTFSAAARDPQAAHLVGEFGARTIPARRLLAPGALAHAVRVNLSPAGRAGSATAKENRALLRRRAQAAGFTRPVAAASRP